MDKDIDCFYESGHYFLEDSISKKELIFGSIVLISIVFFIFYGIVSFCSDIINLL